METEVLGLGGLSRNDFGDINLGDSHISGAYGLLNNGCNAPALEAADWAGLHDLNLVSNVGFIFLVMNVHHRLAVNDLMIERMWNLVRNRDLDRLVAGATGDESDQRLAAGLAGLL